MDKIYCVECWGSEVTVKEIIVKKETEKMYSCEGYPSRIMKAHFNIVNSTGNTVYTDDIGKGVELLREKQTEDIQKHLNYIDAINKRIAILDDYYKNDLEWG